MMNNFRELETPHYKVTMGFDGEEWNNRARHKKPRVHLWGEEDPDMERPPYTIKGEDPENDELWRQYNRAELKIMRRHVQAAILELNFQDDVTFHFSKFAGCSCPCSPGFIIKNYSNREVPGTDGERITFISITVK